MRMIAAFDRPGRFFKGNLHSHSTDSDGRYPPERVCAIYRDAGYDFLALTDHFLPAYRFPVTDTRAYRTENFTTIHGAEMHVPATRLGELWHILAVGLPLDFAPTRDGETAPEIAARCADAGAFVSVVHPAWYGLTADEADSIRAAHSIEIYNHTSAVKNDRGDGWAVLDELLARGRRLSACATDDAHFHFDDAFGGWVMVKADALDPDALVRALRAGDYYSSQGPEIHSIAFDDEVLEIACSPAAAVMALGRGSKAVNELGAGMTRVRLPIERVRRGGYARVVVIDAAGRRAWSNPFWFDTEAGHDVKTEP